jgi:hypothetical protein
MLRRLLGSLGLEDAFVNAYLQAAIRAPTALQNVSLQEEPLSDTLPGFHMLSTSPEVNPSIRRPRRVLANSSNTTKIEKKLQSGFNTISGQFTQGSSSPWIIFTPESLDSGQHNPIEDATRNDNTSTLFDVVDSFPELSLDISSSLADLPCTNPQDDPCLAASATTDHLNALLYPASEGVTLCSIAYSLVMQHNKKGYDFAQLDIKLRIGYTGRSISAGCTVDNKVLFGVLAEIS